MAEEIRSGRPMGRGRGRGKQSKEPEPPRSTASSGMYRPPSATMVRKLINYATVKPYVRTHMITYRGFHVGSHIVKCT